MRSNLPVTNHEYALEPATIITSKTDLNGNITYINQKFMQVSGFSEEELLGAPQNIIRHPDMPTEAFEDLWRTLKAGKAWTGLVKNRCKNGDHYWVEATASPISMNGKPIGYTSVRVTPTREQVNAAEAAYRAIKDGDKRLVIREGKVYSHTRLDFASVFARLSLQTKFLLHALLSILLLIGIAAMSLLEGTQTNYYIYGIIGLGIMVEITFNLLTYRSIFLPLAQAKKDIQAMSEGDLSEHITSTGDDEVGSMTQALRVLQVNIKLLISQIVESSLLVTTGADEIAHGNLDLSARTESQASSLEQTAASMEQLTATVKHNSENAREANNLVLTTSKTASHGGDDVSQVINTMRAISESSNKIADIIGVIDGIAFQTNILALNAAVEAARAGEQGRGFAVVATEVRNLAQRSASAAKEIKQLIQDSVATVNTGGKLVDDAGNTMVNIVHGISHVAEIMSSITHASQEQSAGIEQINQAVTQMDQITQQNAALVEEAAAASESLKNQAGILLNLVNSFRLTSGSNDVVRLNNITASRQHYAVHHLTAPSTRMVNVKKVAKATSFINTSALSDHDAD